MRRVVLAITVSAFVHALLAVALVAYFRYAPEPKTLAELDISSVELSFAENDDETAAVAPMPPSAPPESPPHQETRPPEPPAAEMQPLPSDPDSLDIRPPEAEIEPMIEAVEEEASVASASQNAPQQARIDAPPRPRRAIRPVYPDESRRRGEQGDVVLEIHVDATGAVNGVSVVSTSGFAGLDDAAVRAVRAAQFTPAMSGGAGVSSTARLKLTFRLRN